MDKSKTMMFVSILLAIAFGCIFGDSFKYKVAYAAQVNGNNIAKEIQIENNGKAGARVMGLEITKEVIYELD